MDILDQHERLDLYQTARINVSHEASCLASRMIDRALLIDYSASRRRTILDVMRAFANSLQTARIVVHDLFGLSVLSGGGIGGTIRTVWSGDRLGGDSALAFTAAHAGDNGRDDTLRPDNDCQKQNQQCANLRHGIKSHH